MKGKVKSNWAASACMQAHKLAVKLQAGKRTGKAARKQARAANRTEAAEKREAVVAAAPADEVGNDPAPSSRRHSHHPALVGVSHVSKLAHSAPTSCVHFSVTPC